MEGMSLWGVAVRADFNAERHSRQEHEASVSSPSGHQCRAAHTHPSSLSDHAVSCSTELVVGLQSQQEREREVTPMPSGQSNSANARALVSILQVSLSSSPLVSLPRTFMAIASLKPYSEGTFESWFQSFLGADWVTRSGD